MVYINDTSGTITIPKHMETVSDSGYTIVLTSNLSNDVVLVKNGGDISTNSLYYKFALNNLSNLNVGEYTYRLYDDSEHVVEVGLLTFGTFKRQVIVNNTFDREIIQYNPDVIKDISRFKNNTLYYGFGQNIDSMLGYAETKVANNDLEYSLRSISHEDDAHYYVIYKNENMKGKTPIEFTCGGCPMVMYKREEIIDNVMCTVWESGEIYNPNTELSVISINL